MDSAPENKFHTPTLQELEAARKDFRGEDPRDLFYRAGTELVDLAWRRATLLSVAEALAVFLQTWNKAYYRFQKFDEKHFSDIEHLISCNRQVLADFRQRTLESFCNKDEVTIKRLFMSFEQVLGPVGAAKCLHLLAPRFFPLWDRAIAKSYGFPLRQRGRNGERHYSFMQIIKEQSKSLGGEQVIGRNPLKAIDEYNFCHYKKGSI